MMPQPNPYLKNSLAGAKAEKVFEKVRNTKIQKFKGTKRPSNVKHCGSAGYVAICHKG